MQPGRYSCDSKEAAMVDICLVQGLFQGGVYLTEATCGELRMGQCLARDSLNYILRYIDISTSLRAHGVLMTGDKERVGNMWNYPASQTRNLDVSTISSFRSCCDHY